MKVTNLQLEMISLSFICGFMSMVMYSLKRSYPASIQGLREWSMGLLTLVIGCLLAALRGAVPDFFALALPLLFALIGLCLNYFGTQRFFGIQPRLRAWRLWWALALTSAICFNWIVPYPLMHLRFILLLIACLSGLYGYLVFKQGAHTLAKVLTLIPLVAMVVFPSMRLVATFLVPAGGELLTNEVRELIFITCLLFSVVLSSISMVLMASDRLRAELQHMASHDSLTNALTRRRINTACQTELARCRRHSANMALLLIDLDNFKAVNDNFGHQAGDRVLISFVCQVRNLLRQADQLGRYGGEEFLLLLPETTLTEASLVAERIRALCATPNHEPSCTVSIGVVSTHYDNETLEGLIARADVAMYRAKANGRNRLEMV
jgi:diguanylate cyclase (GGDEF)-like protein